MDIKNTIEISEVDESFDTWINQPFVPENLKPELKQASILIVPVIGFRRDGEATFPVGTDNVLAFFKEKLPPGIIVDICIDDAGYMELSLHSNFKRIGTFIVTSILLPVFVTVLSDFVKEKILKGSEDKPTVQIITINQSNNETLGNHNSADNGKKSDSHVLPKKYLEPAKIKFSVTVVDSANGKSKKFEYEGPAKDIEKVANEMKKLAANDNQ